jgi:hypothetical protein
MNELHLRELSLGVVRASAIEDRSGRWRKVQHEVDRAFALLKRERLKRENLDVLIGENLQRFPSVPGRSSKRIVNSLMTGMAGTSLRCTSGTGWPVPARFSVAQNPTLARRAHQGAAC